MVWTLSEKIVNAVGTGEDPAELDNLELQSAVLQDLTASAAELNILDGATVTAAELNYLDIATLGTGVVREEMVFAFEEAIFFENGRLTADGQHLDLAHLKGNGRVLLQLDGTLRAMPIPVGAPMVVPLHRVVGWFGRVSPRLMGFGGRAAIELTGEGYALLGTPAEGR